LQICSGSITSCVITTGCSRNTDRPDLKGVSIVPKKPAKRAAKAAPAKRGRTAKAAVVAVAPAAGRGRVTGRPPGRPPKRLKLPPGRVVSQLKAVLKINGRLIKRIEKLVELLAD
jgi:hypothetical protein